MAIEVGGEVFGSDRGEQESALVAKFPQWSFGRVRCPLRMAGIPPRTHRPRPRRGPCVRRPPLSQWSGGGRRHDHSRPTGCHLRPACRPTPAQTADPQRLLDRHRGQPLRP
jgi:hypothetical protein